MNFIFLAKKYRFHVIVLFPVLILSFISIVIGLKQLYLFGVDCQIEGAEILREQLSPYNEYLKNPSSFSFSRIPTHLPQEYFLLLPFTSISYPINYLLYGLVGITILCYTYLKDNRNVYALTILLLIISSNSFRNNLGNGQFLFFYLGFFLLFHNFILKKNSKIYNYVISPILLLLLASKPTTFFWIIIFYPINLKSIKIYLSYALYQLAILLFFAYYTDSTLTLFFKNYLSILQEHKGLISDVESIYSINFSNVHLSINSMGVIISLAFYIYFFINKCFKKMEIPSYLYMHVCIILSFILIYHRFYDAFMIFIPWMIYYKKTPNKIHFIYLITILIMIFTRLYSFTSISHITLNSLIILCTLSISITLVFIKNKSIRVLQRKNNLSKYRP